jgi:hypothetical protein
MDLDLAIHNMRSLGSEAQNASYQIAAMAPLLFAERGDLYDREIMLASQAFLRSATDAASPFRSAALPIISAKMSLSQDGVASLRSAENCHIYMSSIGFAGPQSLPASAICSWEVSSNAAVSSVRQVCERAMAFYSLLRNSHSMHIGPLDSAIACHVAMLPLDMGPAAAFVEDAFARLGQLNYGFSILELALAELCLIAGREDYGDRITEMRAKLKTFTRFAKRDSMAYWGSAALLSDDVGWAAEAIADINERLKAISAFRRLPSSHSLCFSSLVYCIGAKDGTYPIAKDMPRQVSYSLLEATKACAFANFLKLSGNQQMLSR